jgi:hypothetical protein
LGDAVAGPLFDSGRKRFMERLLGEIEFAEETY